MCTQVGTGAGGGCGHRWAQMLGQMCTQVGQVQEVSVHIGRTGEGGGCVLRWAQVQEVGVDTGRRGTGGGCAHR